MYEFLDYVAGDVMSRKPVTVTGATTLAEVERLFDEHGFNGMPVVESNGFIAGWVTKLDVLRAFRFDGGGMFPAYTEIMQRPVSDIMGRDIETVSLRTPLTRVLEKLVATGNKSFPVADDGRVIGIVSREDVLGALQRAASGEKPPSGPPEI